jgi:hypothetical protein
MATTTTDTFRIETIAAADLDRARRTGVDVSGNPVERVVLSGGEPMRCCLSYGRAGETAILFGYEPRIPASPYREIGAVFAHADPCGGPDPGTSYPPEWRSRAQVLRAYDRRGWIHPSTRVYEGGDPEAVIADMFADPEVEQIHSRNIAYGCYMFTIRRPANS